MGKIFISYRRDDSNEVTGRIFDHLSKKFNKKNIFKDVDSIPLGSNFKETIEASVQSCEVILAIIGDKWSTISDDSNNRRIDDKNDFVRIEIEAGLSRGIPVIPVLVSGAKMPTINELPEPLKDLAFQNGLPVRHDPDFKNDIDKLSRSLKQIINKKNNSKKMVVLLAALSGVIVPIVYLGINNKDTTGTKETNLSETTRNPISTTQASNEAKSITSFTDTKEIQGFDVSGIELGMTPDDIKNKTLLEYDLKEVKKDGKTAYFTTFSVKGSVHENQEYFHYTFDKNKKLIHVSRNLSYGLTTNPSPDWKKIDSDIFKKYGKPHLEASNDYKITPNETERGASYCWGSCYLKKYSGSTFLRGKSKGKYLMINRKPSAFTYEGTQRYYHSLTFSLTSSDAYLKAIRNESQKYKHKDDLEL